MPPTLTPQIIAAAIDGFESQKRRIDLQIAELRSLLSGDVAADVATTLEAATGKRKQFSHASRRKMAAAQKARWAKIKGESEPTAPASTAKRKMSAAQRKRWAESKQAIAPPKKAPAKKKISPARKAALIANLAKARAARAAKRAAA